MPDAEKQDQTQHAGHDPAVDPLDELEEVQDEELPSKMHKLAEKPTKLPKKIRSGGDESYYPMHRRK
ncbi:hypothetical protein IH979_03010 [Patescibacteria group bacterium]|nr:hypothetical protein [Patescibacteria group bacterium]